MAIGGIRLPRKEIFSGDQMSVCGPLEVVHSDYRLRHIFSDRDRAMIFEEDRRTLTEHFSNFVPVFLGIDLIAA